MPKADGDDPEADDDPLAKLRGDLRSAKGRAVLVESMATAWGEGPGASGQGAGWKQHRFGADPPPKCSKRLRTSVSRDVLEFACGVPPALLSAADRNGRQGRVAQMGDVVMRFHGSALISGELGAKLAPVEITFDGLYARDLVGRSAGAFSASCEGGDAVTGGARGMRALESVDLDARRDLHRPSGITRLSGARKQADASTVLAARVGVYVSRGDERLYTWSSH